VRSWSFFFYNIIHHACDFFLLQARAEMDKFIEPIQQHPDKREGALPYYLLHKEGEHVYGTVLMFHGFAASTGQMARLAQYLFENGFNVYQPALCGHYYNNPAKYWPKVR
jgi:alpha-beta hydrolase superfamily lysophospholipase